MKEIPPKDCLELVREIAKRIAAAGGRAYFVGGFVRDQLRATSENAGNELRLLNSSAPIPDLDIEVHQLEATKLEAILQIYGPIRYVGRSFGVYSLDGYAVDIALPRKEICIGQKHADFKIDVDPYLGLREAAMRRDFTANACMQDILTGAISDPFHGCADIAQGRLRHISTKHFGEDPLRVLRAAQFAARFGWQVARETIELCRQIDLSNLSKERVEQELNKALLQAERPSIFFATLRQMKQLTFWFQEIEKLIDVPQSPQHHAEGDVWTHTMLVLDQAAQLRHQAENPLAFMLAALLHDLGKISCTRLEVGRLRSLGHEKESVLWGDIFLQRIYGDRRLQKRVLNLVGQHMRPHQLAKQNSSFRATNRLFYASLSPHDLLLLAQADERGRIKLDALASKGTSNLDEIFTKVLVQGQDVTSFYSPDYLQQRAQEEAFLRQRQADFAKLLLQPQVKGCDLLQLGLTPSPYWKDLLGFAQQLHLSGVEREAALQQVLQKAREDNQITLEEWQHAKKILQEQAKKVPPNSEKISKK